GPAQLGDGQLWALLGRRQSLYRRRRGVRVQGAQEPDADDHGAGDALRRPHRHPPAAGRAVSAGLAVDRRTTLAWLAAALAMPESARGTGLEGTRWPAVQLAPVTAPGYGVDPNLHEPAVPWPLTLTKAELAAAAAMCDMILP